MQYIPCLAAQQLYYGPSACGTLRKTFYKTLCLTYCRSLYFELHKIVDFASGMHLPELPLYPLSVGPLHEDLSVRHVVHEVALNLVVLLRLERSASVGHAASEHPFKSEWGGGVNPLQFHCIK